MEYKKLTFEQALTAIYNRELAIYSDHQQYTIELVKIIWPYDRCFCSGRSNYYQQDRVGGRWMWHNNHQGSIKIINSKELYHLYLLYREEMERNINKTDFQTIQF